MKKESKKVDTCCGIVGPMKMKPSMRMDEDDYPEMKDMKMGEECMVKCKIKMKSMSMGDEYSENSENKKVSGRFEIMDMEPIEGRKTMDTPRAKKLEVLKEKAK